MKRECRPCWRLSKSFIRLIFVCFMFSFIVRVLWALMFVFLLVFLILHSTLFCGIESGCTLIFIKYHWLCLNVGCNVNFYSSKHSDHKNRNPLRSLLQFEAQFLWWFLYLIQNTTRKTQMQSNTPPQTLPYKSSLTPSQHKLLSIVGVYWVTLLHIVHVLFCWLFGVHYM